MKKGLPIGLLEHVCSAEVSAIQTVETESPSDKVTGNAPVKEAKLDHMPSYQEKALRKLLDQYEDIFSKGEHDFGKTNVVTLKFDTGDHPPIKQRPYKKLFAERPKVDQHINDMLEAAVISPSNSPWASPIVIVPKKDGTKRICVDYRKGVNKVLRNNSYPLSDISDILSSLHQSKYFSCVDLKCGYWQVEVEPEDRQKTAFVCHAGLFEFNVMPFGLSSAPPIYQELMNKVLGQAMYKYAIAYLDDVIIYSSTFQEHLNQPRYLVSSGLQV